jgi:seryl-tRNA synthetase
MEEFTEFTPETKRALMGMIDSRIEEKIKDRLPRREDFSELKSIVQELAKAQDRTEKRMGELAKAQDRTEKRVEELAEAQGRTEKRMGELAEAQGRTEKRVEELAQAQGRTEKRIEELAQAQGRTEVQVQNLARSVGKLSDNIGFGLEDIARVVLPGYLERHLGILVKEFSRKFFSVNGDEVEINLYAAGKREGKRITVLGECKSRIHRREVRSFLRQADKVRGLLKGDILLVLFGYWIHPSASMFAEEKGVHLIASYQR